MPSFKIFLRNSPHWYSLVYKLRFYLSPLRVFRITYDRIFHPKHRQNSTVLAGPNYLGFKGGVYNPGAVPISKNNILLLAKAQKCHWWDAVGLNVDQYYKGDPVMFVLNEELNILSSRIVQMDNSFKLSDKVGYEDFRLFRFRSEIWVNHGMISIIKRHNSAATYNAATSYLSRLDTESGVLSFQGYPQLDFEVGKVEKNWLYFEHNECLYLIYSINPYRLLKLTNAEDLKFETVKYENIGGKLNDIGGFGTMVSLSTNPIEFNENQYLFLIHQVKYKGIERYYYHWGILMDKETLHPKKITKKPLFIGEGTRGRRPGIIYVSSIVKRTHDFIFFMGEGDAYVTYSVLKRNKIESLLVNID